MSFGQTLVEYFVGNWLLDHLQANELPVAVPKSNNEI